MRASRVAVALLAVVWVTATVYMVMYLSSRHVSLLVPDMGLERRAPASPDQTSQLATVTPAISSTTTPDPLCSIGAWSPWSQCDTPCGTGVRSRRRRRKDLKQLPLCTPLTESQACIRQPCSAPCTPAQWAPWSACSLPCAGMMAEGADLAGVRVRKQLAAEVGTALLCDQPQHQIESCVAPPICPPPDEAPENATANGWEILSCANANLIQYTDGIF